MTLSIGMAVALTHSLPKTEAENIINSKNLALEIKNI